MNRTRTQHKSGYQTHVVFGLSALALALVAGYVTCVYGSVVSVVERDKAEQTYADIASQVVTLEQEYMKLSESITVEEAQRLGFVEPEKTLFAVRASDTRVTMANE
jgi:cytochrome b561